MAPFLALGFVGFLFLIHPIAALVALLLTVAWLLLLRGGVDAAFDGWAGLGFVAAWIASRRRRGRGLAGLDWFCVNCKSLNASAASACYHGCGPRETTEWVGRYPAPIEGSAGRTQRDRRHG